MELTIDRETFASAVASVRAATDRASTMPILAYVHLRASESGEIQLTATDLVIQIQTSLKARVKSPGRACLRADVLHALLSKLPGAEVELVVDERRAAEFRQEGRRVTLEGVDTADYPRPKAAPKTTSAQVPAEGLAAILAAVEHAACTNETRYHICGVHLEAEGQNLVAVATDGHRLATTSLTLGAAPLELPAGGVTIPTRGVEAIVELVGGREGEVRIALGWREEKPVDLRLEVEETSLVVDLVAAEYPDYRQVLPKGKAKHGAVVAREDLESALKRVMLITREDRERQANNKVVRTRRTGTHLHLDPVGFLRIDGEARDIGSISERLEAEIEGPTFLIGLAGDYVLDAVQACGAQKVSLSFTEKISPVVVRPAGDERFTCVIMPMRL
jgi:DNA polymerase-3 subunit beta